MLRKVLRPTTANEESALLKHRNLLTSSPPDLNQDFLRFAKEEVRRLFRHGWDRPYYSAACAHYSPSGSATSSSSRKVGGLSRDLCGTETAFTTFTRATREYDVEEWDPRAPVSLPSPVVKVAAVKENGKVRVVTVGNAEQSRLKPLHEAIYNRLTKEKWCLRGDAKPSSFADFRSRQGEVFVSGDYESATDFLDIETTEELLKIVLHQAVTVPPPVKDLAMSSLRNVLQYPDGQRVTQVRGQLMGAYLSFPLLCLRNYLAFRYLVRDPSIPVRINGDDIVFRARPSVAESWMDGIERTGLKLSKGKTLQLSERFSLNSTFFEARARRRPWLCPVIRAKSLLSRECPPDGESYRAYLSGWSRSGFTWESRRRKIGALWLRKKRPAIDALGRGVWGLGIPALPSEIHEAGLVRVESFFNPALRHGRIRCPVPKLAFDPNPDLMYRKGDKEEVRRVAPRVVKEWQEGARHAFHCWSWNHVRDNGMMEKQWKDSVRSGLGGAIRNFLGLLKKSSKLYRGRGYNLPLGNPPKRKKKVLWIPKDWIPRTHEVTFEPSTCVGEPSGLPDRLELAGRT